MLTVAEAQALLGCSQSTIYRFIHHKDFPKKEKRDLKSYIFSEDEFRKWVTSHGYKLRGEHNGF